MSGLTQSYKSYQNTKKKWSITPRELISKVKQSILILITLGSIDLSVYFIIHGFQFYYPLIVIMLGVLANITREIGFRKRLHMVANQDIDPSELEPEDLQDDPLPKYWLYFIVYIVSGIGITMTISSFFISNDYQFDKVVYFGFTGIILTFLSRYLSTRPNLIAIIEDYFIYFMTWISHSLLFLSFTTFIDNPVRSLIQLIITTTLSGVMLYLHNKSKNREVPKWTFKLYIALIAQSLGVALIMLGITAIWTHNIYLLLAIPEGVICLLGGGIAYEQKKLISLKDIF